MDSPVVESKNSRLIFILPDSLAGNLELAHQLHRIALMEHRDIFYLTLVKDTDAMLPLIRQLTSMKAATVGEDIRAFSKCISQDDWLESLKKIYRPGDALMCPEELTVKSGFMQSIPMTTVLYEKFKTPVRFIAGAWMNGHKPVWQHLYQIIFWLGCLLILGLFSMIEISIDRYFQGFTHIALLGIVFVVEFGSLIVWNHFPQK
jgi:hypothetical protein